MDSFQQKNRSSTPINGSWSVLLDYNRITELLGLAMKKNSTRKKFQKNVTDTPASDNAISSTLYDEQHSFKASFLWYSKSVILFLSLFINVQWISYLKIEGKICVQHHPSLIRTSGGSGKTPGVAWAAGCGGTGVVVGGTTTGTGGAGGTAGTMVPVVFRLGPTHPPCLGDESHSTQVNCSRSVDDCAFFQQEFELVVAWHSEKGNKFMSFHRNLYLIQYVKRYTKVKVLVSFLNFCEFHGWPKKC